MLFLRSFIGQKYASVILNVPMRLRARAPLPIASQLCLVLSRNSSSASSKLWQERQSKDRYTKEAKLQNLKSRAAFKLLEINEKYRLFKSGQTIVDLGYAPGSWSQVAIDRASPGGRVLGIDIIPAQPPKGVSTIQGNFLSPAVQAEVKRYLLDPNRGRPRPRNLISTFSFDDDSTASSSTMTMEELEQAEKGYVDLQKQTNTQTASLSAESSEEDEQKNHVSFHEQDMASGRTVDVVLSDMCEPWVQPLGLYKRSVSQPYHRMMNTSGNKLRDHAGSMDLCFAALLFVYDALKINGHFVCKFYQGSEDKILEKRLKRLFCKVHREKPASSRSESKEMYFVALRRKPDVAQEDVFF